MAINRWGLVTGETASNTEFLGLSSTLPDLSTVQVHTGNYSWHFFDYERTIALGLPLINCLRSNYFAYHTAGSVGDDAVLFLVHSAGVATYAIDIRWNGVSDLIEMRVGGVLQASVAPFVAGITPTNTWLPIGLFARSGVTGAVILYIDGIEALRYEGPVTENFDYITAGGQRPTGILPTGWDMYLDDWYVEELTGSDMVEQSPPSPRWMVATVENTVSAQWEPFGVEDNADAVNDPAAHDGDTTYVMANENGLRDMYAFSNITLPVNYTIAAVVPYAIARKTDAGMDGKLKFLAFDGVSYGEGLAPFLPVSYRPVYGRITRQPNGSVWTQAAFNSARFGFESDGEFE